MLLDLYGSGVIGSWFDRGYNNGGRAKFTPPSLVVQPTAARSAFLRQGKAPVDASYLALAAKYIRRQAKQLAEQLDGVCRAEDIEFVHRARVASRRLRAALRMFRRCFGRKTVKRWRKQIRRVTSELGDARDIDVQIEFLCGAMHSVHQPACYPGIARLLVQWEHRRGLLQTNVVKAVERLRSSGVLEEMQAVAKRALADPKTEAISVPSPIACRETAKHIRRRLKQALRYQDSLCDPQDLQRHHALRIAAKRLRYTLEIAKPVYDQQLEPIVEAVKKVQTLLGDVHDCDVWLQRLEAFAAAERENVLAQFGGAGPFSRLSVGIEYLRQDRGNRRQQAFGELVEYWEALQRQGLWETLLGIVAVPGEQPAKPPAPAAASLPPPSLPPGPLPAAAELSPHWQKFGSAEVRENPTQVPRPRGELFSEPARQINSPPPPAAVATAPR
jgi:CHAD domain-containing protein